MPAPVAAPDRALLGITFRLLGGAFWILTSALAKAAGEAGANLVQMVFFRHLLGFLVIAAFILATSGAASLRTDRPVAHARRAVIGLLAIGLGFQALRLAPLTEVTAIGFTAPLFVTLLSWPLLRQKVGPLQGVAVAVGFVGVLVMVRPDPHHLVNLGAALALGAAVFTALTTLTVADLGRTERGPTIVFYNLLFAAIASTLPLPFFWQAMPPKAWFLLIVMGVLSAVPQLLFTQAVRLTRPVVVAPFDYGQLIWAAALSWLVWQDPIRPSTLAGGLIVAAAGLIILFVEARRRRAD
jgi:drug/metabolite transporter (DMT)-like permease